MDFVTLNIEGKTKGKVVKKRKNLHTILGVLIHIVKVNTTF